MKHLTLLFAATAAALVAPSPDRPQQIAFIEKQQAAQDAVQTWWNALPSPGSFFSTIETRVTRSVQRAINGGLDLDTDGGDDGDEGEDDPDHGHPPHHRPPRRGHRHRGDKTKTIYELIKDSKYTTKFAKLIEEHDEIKSLLSDTEHNHTLFVPTDKAFERIPHHKDPPSKEFILALLKYHTLPGLYTAGRVVHSYTLPTELSPGSLGDHPQRLRVSIGFLFTLQLNLYSKVVAGNIEAKNGVIHAVNGILVPPPSQAKIISLLPGAFSTFSLGLETTGLAKELEKSDEVGGTLFAPTNRAFEKLGPGANAFLFSERGKKYLKAILKYHVVLGETLYSDAFYKKKKDDGDGDGDDDGDDDKTEGGRGYWHVDLPSQLDDKAIAVDVKRWKGFVSIVLNGFTRVALQDGVASDGVIQVINSVLIPPHKHDSGQGAAGDEQQRGGEISVEELKSRLGPYVEGQAGSGMNDL